MAMCVLIVALRLVGLMANADAQNVKGSTEEKIRRKKCVSLELCGQPKTLDLSLKIAILERLFLKKWGYMKERLLPH